MKFEDEHDTFYESAMNASAKSDKVSYQTPNIPSQQSFYNPFDEFDTANNGFV